VGYAVSPFADWVVPGRNSRVHPTFLNDFYVLGEPALRAEPPVLPQICRFYEFCNYLRSTFFFLKYTRPYARFTHKMVLPDPPFKFTTEITCGYWPIPLPFGEAARFGCSYHLICIIVNTLASGSQGKRI
jgi:hypothetical protein